MNPTIKGLFLKDLVRTVEKKGGSKKELSEYFEGNLDFSPLKNYSTEVLRKLHDATAIVLYGKNDGQTQFELGKLGFKSYANNLLIGKMMLSLVEKNIDKIVSSLPKILNSVTPRLDVEMRPLGPNKIQMRIKNNDLHINFYSGLWTAAIEYFGYQPVIESKMIGRNDHEYIIEWR